MDHSASSSVGLIVAGAVFAAFSATVAAYSIRNRSNMLQLGCGGIFFAMIGVVTMITGVVLAILAR